MMRFLRQGQWRSVALVLIPAFALVAAAWVLAWNLVARDFAETLAHEETQNANLALAFEQHTVRTLKQLDQLIKYVRREYAGRPAELDLGEIGTVMDLDPSLISAIVVTDAEGRVVAPANPDVPVTTADRDYFRFHRDTPWDVLRIGAPIRSRITGVPVIAMTRRIDLNDRFAGVVSVGIHPGYFTDFYGHMDIGRDGMVMLVGLDGIARARRAGDASSAGQDMTGSTLFQQQARQVNGTFLSIGRLEGIPRYTSYRTIAEYGLIVAVGSSQQEVLAPVLARRAQYFVGAGVFTALVLAFSGAVILLQQRRAALVEERARDDARFHATFHQAAVGMAHIGLDGRVLKVNGKLCEMIGYSGAELIGRNFTEFKFTEEERELADGMRKEMLQVGSLPPGEHRYRRKDGSELWANVSIALVQDPKGEPDYFVAVAQDITAQKEAQRTIFHQATHDLLTDLPNRAMFQDRLRKALGQAHRHGWTGGVLFMDLDKFKQVNDSFGHAAGDALLREVAGRLRHCVRAEDTAARIGGDEFAVVLAEVSHARDAAVVAQKILEEMAAPMLLEGHRYELTVSIGITLFPADGDDVEQLLRNADEAMFRAKQAGRNCFRFHDAVMDAEAA